MHIARFIQLQSGRAHAHHAAQIEDAIDLASLFIFDTQVEMFLLAILM